MFDRRTNSRTPDARTLDMIRARHWAGKREQAAQGAAVLARMDAAGVDSIAALMAIAKA